MQALIVLTYQSLVLQIATEQMSENIQIPLCGSTNTISLMVFCDFPNLGKNYFVHDVFLSFLTIMTLVEEDTERVKI